MRVLLEALNKPIDAFRIKNKNVAWGLVAFTIIINTVFEPILQRYAGTNQHEIDLIHMLTITLLGICTYITICIVFWLVSKAFGSKTSFNGYIITWGITYFPTILCSIIVAITEVFFYMFWNSVIWGMIFNILFVGILLWKTVLYILYLQEVAGLKGGKIIGAFIAIGIFIILLAMANGYVGLKTPIL
jgi:hypothetical protein